jgi:hypothetical protein
MHELNRVCHFVMGLQLGPSNLGQVQAWRELAHLTDRNHHESGRLFECGTRWKVWIQKG